MSNELVLYPDSVLDDECTEVDDPESVDDLIDDMTEILYDKEGIGLAAPQVGETIQLFLLRLDLDRRLHEAYINPEILEIEDSEQLDEGCLSFPNISVEIERGLTVHFQAVTPTGKEVQRTVEGIQAQCVQHEIDHLYGTTIADRADLTQKLAIEDDLKTLERGEIPQPDESESS